MVPFGVGAPPILVYSRGIGMFTGGTGFRPMAICLGLPFAAFFAGSSLKGPRIDQNTRTLRHVFFLGECSFCVFCVFPKPRTTSQQELALHPWNSGTVVELWRF